MVRDHNRWRWVRPSLALTVMWVVGVSACVADEPPPSSPAPTAQNRGIAAGECETGAERACYVELGEANGVTSCYRGQQRCESGGWGACSDGLFSNISTPDPEDSQWESLALSTAGNCVFNPCNPECQHFDEEIPGGWVADGNANQFSWPWGDPNSVPQAVQDKAQTEPCSTGADCQMNQYCFDPTSDTCSHDICEIGGGLEAGCSTCSDDICATNPGCCEKPYGGTTCAHSECTAGVALDDTCSTCAASVCSYDSYCCNTSWDGICVSEAVSDPACASTCAASCAGQSCAHDVCTTGVALDATCDSCVADSCAYDSWCCSASWDSICTANTALFPSCASGGGGGAVCSHDPCSTGAALTDGCANYVDTVCAADASCCSATWGPSCVALFNSLTPGGCPSSWPGDWDQTCVNAVNSECGAYCDAPPAGTGQCIGWNPGATNPNCNGIDLSVGLTCDDTVPICNHGTQTAVAPINVIHVPENGGYFADPNPPAGIAGEVVCTTTEDIAPGQCVGVSCPGISEYREIMVNPPNGNTNWVAECNPLDNWGIYVGGTCGAPSCANETITANIKPVNMFIAMDKSGSMGGTRWTSSKSAFTSFFQAPEAAGIGVALEFFPYSGCYNNSSECGNPANCSDPYVPLGLLTAASAPADTQEASLISAFNNFSPGGGTPAILAFQGCQQWAATYSAANPNEQQVCILVTDGYPNSCGSATAGFTTAAADGYNNYGVISYGIGIVGANQTLLNAIAAAGNGEAFFVGSGNVEQDLLDALLAIAGQALSCDIALPGGNYDPSDAIVEFTPSGGTTATISQVADLASCMAAGGWYFDDPSNPASITLCPVTCTTVQADATGEIQMTFPCQATLQTTTYTQEYEASCAGGKTPQWGFFAYDTDTPAGTSVVFDIGWADDQAGLATATTIPVGTAQAGPPDTSLCTLGANISGCPINLFDAAGGAPDAYQPWMKIVTTLNPDAALTAGPTVNGYDVTYTCVDLL